MFRNSPGSTSGSGGRRSRGFTQPMTDAEADDCIAKWVAILALAVPIRHERISIWQVTGESGRPGCGLVGVYCDDAAGDAEKESVACILHTRRLTEEDIVHELLHVAHPAWSEGQVVGETAHLAAVGSPDRSRRTAARPRLSRRDCFGATSEGCTTKGTKNEWHSV